MPLQPCWTLATKTKTTYGALKESRWKRPKLPFRSSASSSITRLQHRHHPRNFVCCTTAIWQPIGPWHFPKRTKNAWYYRDHSILGRPGVQEVFQELVDDQTGKQHYSISLVGGPSMGKRSLVATAAEYIAFKKKKKFLWVSRRWEGKEISGL